MRRGRETVDCTQCAALTRYPADTPPTKKNYGRNHHLLKRNDDIRPALIARGMPPAIQGKHAEGQNY
jgi:hypothetical protein